VTERPEQGAERPNIAAVPSPEHRVLEAVADQLSELVARVEEQIARQTRSQQRVDDLASAAQAAVEDAEHRLAHVERRLDTTADRAADVESLRTEFERARSRAGQEIAAMRHALDDARGELVTAWEAGAAELRAELAAAVAELREADAAEAERAHGELEAGAAALREVLEARSVELRSELDVRTGRLAERDEELRRDVDDRARAAEEQLGRVESGLRAELESQAGEVRGEVERVESGLQGELEAAIRAARDEVERARTELGREAESRVGELARDAERRAADTRSDIDEVRDAVQRLERSSGDVRSDLDSGISDLRRELDSRTGEIRTAVHDSLEDLGRLRPELEAARARSAKELAAVRRMVEDARVDLGGAGTRTEERLAREEASRRELAGELVADREHTTAELRAAAGARVELAERLTAGEARLTELEAASRAAREELEERIRAESEERAARYEELRDRLGLRDAADGEARPAAHARVRAALAGQPDPRPLGPWLARALRALAGEDPGAAEDLICELIGVHGQVADAPADWELTFKGGGAYRVSVQPGRTSVAPADPGVDRGGADFSVRGDAVAIADALSGRRVRRKRLEVHGSRRRARRELEGLGRAAGSLINLGRAGVWLDPGLVCRALAHEVDPAWTAGHDFRVALEVPGPCGGRWFVQARDGARLAVSDRIQGQEADAGVRMPLTELYRWLSGEHVDVSPHVEGDRRAVGTLAGWVERALAQDPAL